MALERLRRSRCSGGGRRKKGGSRRKGKERWLYMRMWFLQVETDSDSTTHSDTASRKRKLNKDYLTWSTCQPNLFGEDRLILWEKEMSMQYMHAFQGYCWIRASFPLLCTALHSIGPHPARYWRSLAHVAVAVLVLASSCSQNNKKKVMCSSSLFFLLQVCNRDKDEMR